MKISKSKRQLAQLLIEAGVTQFPKGANWVAQCSKGKLASFYGGERPKHNRGESVHYGDYCGARHDVELPTLIPNWHQTVLSRDEFDQIVAETTLDTDVWIEWGGGECPVDVDALVCCKWRSGKVSITTYHAGILSWRHNGNAADIIAYCLHKQEQSEPEFCESVVRSIPEQEAKPTLDQLLQDWRNAYDFAKRKQAEADEAAAMRDERWQAVQDRAGEVGVTVGVCERVSVDWPKLVITDCRYLKVKDEIEVVVPNGGDVTAGERGVIVKLSGNGFWCNFPSQKSYWYYNDQFERGDVKFIRRP